MSEADNARARRIENELAAMKLQQRLSIRPGMEAVAGTLVSGASCSVDPTNLLAIQNAAADLARNNSAVFQTEQAKPDPSAMTAQEREKDLKARGIL